MSDGLDYESAMSETLGIVMASPNFLYLEESRLNAELQHLDGRSFASRLANFLWSAPPDEELYQLASSDELLQAKVLHKQVNRMLDDPRASSFFEGFMNQWAKLDRLNIVSVDWHRFPLHNGAVRFSTAKEPSQFFRILIEENLPIDNLIDSDFIVGDAHLAHYYGIEGNFTHSDFRKIPLPANSSRGGLITQASFLTIGSTGERSSPVIRGSLIMEKFLNDPPPPPPPNVPELGSPLDKPVSNRELVDAHRSQSACASCHDKIDPIGFGLEHFDSIGMWRNTEVIGKQNIPIITRAKLVSGIEFENLDGLKELLKTQKQRLARNMIDSLLAYGIGRQVEFSEEQDIQKALQLAQSRDYLMRDLITIVVNSQTFRSK